MPGYTVQASVVDMTTDTPRADDVFWVDTNVWYWAAYQRVSQLPPDNQPRHYQTTKYPRYLKQALRCGAGLRWFGLSFSELARLVEDAEREIATALGRVPAGTKAKAFRHDYASERQNVVQQLTHCWNAIKSIAQPLCSTLDMSHESLTAALGTMTASALDAYDLFAVKCLQDAGVHQVLTDDGDFCTVPGITLFTANRGVIEAARAQGRLVDR